MPTAKEAIDAYVDAWNTNDPETGRRLVEQAMTEDALMAYPWFEARGCKAISEVIAAYRQRSPAMSIEYTSNVEEHHGWVRFGWRLLGADGSVRSEGEDVGELGEDGRLIRALGFENPLPPVG